MEPPKTTQRGRRTTEHTDENRLSRTQPAADPSTRACGGCRSPTRFDTQPDLTVVAPAPHDRAMVRHDLRGSLAGRARRRTASDQRDRSM